MNRLLIVAILIIGTLRLYAQSQQPNAAELAQKVVGIIAGDKTKTQTYCQVVDLSDELDQVDQKKESKKARKQESRGPVPQDKRITKKPWPRIPRAARGS